MTASQAPEIDPREFRNTLGRFATGVTVVTAEVDGEIHGMTANAFMSVSLDPPLVLVSVDNRAHLIDFLNTSKRYGVSILTEDHVDYSNHFAGRVVEELDVPFVRINDVPLIEDAMAHLVTSVVQAIPAGDHTLYLGQVEYLWWEDKQPLLFYAGQYRKIDAGQ